MTCIDTVRKFIQMLATDTIISTRDVLHLGSRNAIDKAMSSLTKRKELVRIARGLFMKPEAQIPKIEDIARKKAKVFGRLAVLHASAFAIENFCKTLEEVLAEQPSYQPCSSFSTHHITSSFETILGKVNFIGARNAQMQLGETKSGRLTRLLMYTGRLSKLDVEDMLAKVPVEQIREAVKQAKLMPAWLSDAMQKFCSLG